MNISLIPLNTKGRVDFDIKPDMSNYKNDEVIRLEGIHAKGYIKDNGTDDYEVNMHITGTAVLKSARNMSEVRENLDINYEDFIENLVEIYKISANSLDILPIIWENILLEIPIRAVNADDEFISTSGDGWEITSE